MTRQQLTAILWRSAGQSETKSTETFADQSDISSYALPATAWAREIGIVSGKNGNLFDPSGQASRAETAAILHRFVTMDVTAADTTHVNTPDTRPAIPASQRTEGVARLLQEKLGDPVWNGTMASPQIA